MSVGIYDVVGVPDFSFIFENQDSIIVGRPGFEENISIIFWVKNNDVNVFSGTPPKKNIKARNCLCVIYCKKDCHGKNRGSKSCGVVGKKLFIYLIEKIQNEYALEKN